MKPVIYLVDPSEDQRRILSTLLDVAGYETFGWSSAEGALRRIRIQPPDLILGEHPLTLPDGRTLCAALAEDPATREIPFLVLTSRAKAPELASARKMHPAGVLVKPVSLPRIVEAVLELLEPRAEGSPAILDEGGEVGT